MLMTQIYEITNSIAQELLGEETVVDENLSNIVDIGKKIEDLGDNALDAYVKAIINKIGKTVFVNREYNGRAPSVLMDGWEYGSILEKISVELTQAKENDTWQLTKGQNYSMDIYTPPEGVREKFYNKRTTFEIDISLAEKQIKQSFKSAQQLNGFFSMIQTMIKNSMTLRTDALIQRTINNAMAHTFHGLDATGNYTGKTGARAINLLYLYNTKFGTTLTAENCLYDLQFLKFAAYHFMLISDRLTAYSTLFNEGAKERFTPKNLQHIIMLSEFKRAADVYLQSETFHNELTKMPDAESVNFWQGSGTDYSFSSTSDIHVTTMAEDKTEFTVEASGILGCFFDRDALGVTNIDMRVLSHPNHRGEFVNYFYKYDAGYFNDLDENFVVLYVA